MFPRQIQALVQQELQHNPAVALLGPRQVGKTTLAMEVAAQAPGSLYLDLESERDAAKLAQAELFLAEHLDKLVILDEVQRAPGLFPQLRGLIDRARRQGREQGLYLLLGSASLDLLQQSGESLAGRIAYLELGPLTVAEVGAQQQLSLWLRGGFPPSLAAGDARSLRWRQNFIRTYLERDLPQLGSRVPAQTLRRFWTMLAHHQGGLLNMAQLARNLGVDVRTVHSYVDLLCDLLLLRRLPPWHVNVGKRLVRTPKVYIRDSGLVHALLDIETHDTLLSHMVVGGSWEGFCIENILACAPPSATPYFYRTSAGAEVDLLLVWPSGGLWAIEIKRSLSPKPERGFYNACADLNPSQKFIVYPGPDSYPLAEGIRVMPLRDMCSAVAANSNGAQGGQ
jgi:uncharacterized protein